MILMIDMQCSYIFSGVTHPMLSPFWNITVQRRTYLKTFETIMKVCLKAVLKSYWNLILSHFHSICILEGCLEERNIMTPSLQSRKNPVSASAMLTGKFLQFRKVFATKSLLAEEFRILCNTKYPDNMQSVRMNWKFSGQSKRCPDILENVPG